MIVAIWKPFLVCTVGLTKGLKVVNILIREDSLYERCKYIVMENKEEPFGPNLELELPSTHDFIHTYHTIRTHSHTNMMCVPKILVIYPHITYVCMYLYVIVYIYIHTCTYTHMIHMQFLVPPVLSVEKT